jgi:hypothetical protein
VAESGVPLTARRIVSLSRVRPRIFSSVLGAYAVCVLLGGGASAAAASLPLNPRNLLVPRSAFVGLTGAHSELASTASPSVWAEQILEDPQPNGREEVARLTEEGFLEGSREAFTKPTAVAFSGALVFGSSASAAREAKFKTDEELAELGRGAVRFRVRAIPGATGLEQTHPVSSRPPGLHSVSVVFSSGRCLAAVGVALRSRRAARKDALGAAVAMRRRIGHACS